METETVRVNRPQGPIHTEPKRKRRDQKENYKHHKNRFRFQMVWMDLKLKNSPCFVCSKLNKVKPCSHVAVRQRRIPPGSCYTEFWGTSFRRMLSLPQDPFSALRPIHNKLKQKRKRKISLMFVILSLIFFAFASTCIWYELVLSVAIEVTLKNWRWRKRKR